MDQSGSSTSESEIESTFRVVHREKNKKCLICGKTSGNLIKGSDKTLRTLKQRVQTRDSIYKSTSTQSLHQNIVNIESGDKTLLMWHKSCYCSYISKKSIEVLRRKFEKKMQREEFKISETEASVTFRKEIFDINKCVFCQKRHNEKKLSQVLTTNIENKIKKIAQHDSSIMKRIGINDLIAMEIKYHVTCFFKFWRVFKKGRDSQVSSKIKSEHVDPIETLLYKELITGFEKKKGFSISSIYARYTDLGGNLSKRQLINKLKIYFGADIQIIKATNANKSDIIMSSKFSSKDEMLHSFMETEEDSNIPVFMESSEYSVLHSIINNIKLDMNKIPDFATLKNLNLDSYRKYIPEALMWLITLLTSSKNHQATETQILSFCQDIIFAYSHHKKFTPKHVALGIMVHQETRSKKIIEVLHRCGHSISYKNVLQMRNTIAQEEINKYKKNDFTIIPAHIVPKRFVQFAADNIDIIEETLDKAPTFHATQMVVFQQGPPSSDCPEGMKLLPYKTKLDIPDNFHLLNQINMSTSTHPVPILKNKQLLLDLETDPAYMRTHNIAWILARTVHKSFNDIIVPQWTGFHKLLGEHTDIVTTYGYLPLLPYVSSDYDTLWTVLQRCSKMTHILNVSHTVITFDQALYCKAKEIQWLKNDECQNIIIRLGGFHIMMNFLKVIGQYMETSGLKDVWIESDLYSESTVQGIFTGKKWNKGIRAHKLTYESLWRILLPLFEKWLLEAKSDHINSINLAKLTATQLCTNVMENRDFKNEFQSIVASLEECSDVFEEFVNAQSPTVTYWVNYIQLVDILLEFLYAERSGKWDLHLKSLRRMIPWFFAYDHINYSRWAPIYLIDMLNLESTAPNVYAEFVNGNFVIKRLPGNFNTISVDQALEHVNKTSKDAGGIVGLTKNNTRLDEWYLSFNEIGAMIDTFLYSIGGESDFVNQNIETGSKRKTIDEKTVVALQHQFNKFKIFTHTQDSIICISTNTILNTATQESLLNANKIGEEAFIKFVAIIDSSEFYKPLKKNKFIKLCSQSMPVRKDQKVKTQMQGQEILQKVLAAREMGREINYQEIFKHELTCYPMALAINEDILITPSNKSALGALLESYGSTETSDFLHGNASAVCYIYDAMSLVQSLGKPANAKTFGDYAKTFSTIIFKNFVGAKRIDVVFDHYYEISVKNGTRTKRGSKKSIEIEINGENVPLPRQWQLFIHSARNKNQLTNFLSEQISTHSQNQTVEFVTSGGFSDVLEYRSNFGLEDDYLKSNHEEADTRMLLHILSAKKAGYNSCIIDCRDTDVLVLLCHFRQYLTREIWMKVGRKDKVRFIPVHLLNIEPQLLTNLPAFHAFTGCDTTSQFAGLGKKHCWKIYLNSHFLLNDLGITFNAKTFENIHRFTLQLYTDNKDVTSINYLRSLLAISKTVDKLPPSEDSLRLHCLRSHYQAHIWRNALIPRPVFLNFADYGWKLENSDIFPILQTLPSIPTNLAILTSCGCKKDCRKKWCTCRKNGISCTGSCRCLGQKSCLNVKPAKTSVSIDILGNDDEPESDDE